MGINVFTKLDCDCQKSLQNSVSMKRIALKSLNDNQYVIIYQCRFCNRSIRIQISLVYNDYHKGVKFE
jgi:hypothetical protein